MRILLLLLFWQTGFAAVLPQDILDQAKQIDTSIVRQIPVQNNGRLKPFDSLARESILFLSGKYNIEGLDSVRIYLLLATSSESEELKLINIRDVSLREKLNLSREQRYFSMGELRKSPLETLTMPLYEKEEKTPRLVTESEKNILEVAHQFFLANSIANGEHLQQALDATFLSAHGSGSAGPSNENLLTYLKSVASASSDQNTNAQILLNVSNSQAWPEQFMSQIGRVPYEVFYNDLRPFWWAALFLGLLGLVLTFQSIRVKVPELAVNGIFLVALGFLVLGFGLRIYITGFAPVTNMYGTMTWVSLGASVFGWLLYRLYKNIAAFSIILWSCSAMLFLTESIPLVLSPDLDPVVAVLRSNLWLTIHVLTITLSYAAFTVTAVVGNYAMISNWFKPNEKQIKLLAHSCYRMVQLGVFLISVGIVLGGIWADYSWGRFWGWDPKETWALIADLGFIAILHARYVNWIGHYGLLMCSTLGYLLVVMAWYGVNFILATGLHSYGFSSGGQKIVFTYVAVQLLIVSISLLLRLKKVSASSDKS